MLRSSQARRASVTRSGKNLLLLLGEIIVCQFPPPTSFFPNRSLFKPSLHGHSCLLTLITVYSYV